MRISSYDMHPFGNVSTTSVETSSKEFGKYSSVLFLKKTLKF